MKKAMLFPNPRPMCGCYLVAALVAEGLKQKGSNAAAAEDCFNIDVVDDDAVFCFVATCPAVNLVGVFVPCGYVKQRRIKHTVKCCTVLLHIDFTRDAAGPSTFPVALQP